MTKPVSSGELPFGAWLAEAGVAVPAPPQAPAEARPQAPAEAASPAAAAPPAAPWPGPDPGASAFFDTWEDDADADAEPSGGRWRGRALWVGGLALWTVVGVGAGALLLGGEQHAGDAGERAASAPSTADAGLTGTAEAAPAGPEPAEADPAVSDRGDSVLAAHAGVAVRLAVTRHADGAVPARYVDHVAVEQISRERDLAIVTLLAVVLEGAEGRWESTTTRRYGIALQLGDDPWPLGPPWALPADALDRQVPEMGAEASGRDEPARYPAAMTALDAAGYTDVVLLHVTATGHPGLLRARLEAIAPQETAAAEHEVWLRDGHRPHVLGASPTHTFSPTPSAQEQEQS